MTLQKDIEIITKTTMKAWQRKVREIYQTREILFVENFLTLISNRLDLKNPKSKIENS